MNLVTRQRGAATLGITLLLLFVVMLVAAIASRNLVFEQRASANQWRSTQAFEAAEAGLEWAQAMLASDALIGADCKPIARPGATTFRERLLDVDPATRVFSVRTWSDAGNAVPLQAACVRDGDAWHCSCPHAGHPALDAPGAGGAHPAFAIRFAASARSGQIQLVATGCDRLAAECLPGLPGAATGGSTAHAQVALGLLPALAAMPTAALTVAGAIDAGGALVLANTDARAAGVTAHAGGTIALAAATLETLPGVPAESSLAERDALLETLDAERATALFLGLHAARWQRLPGLQTLACAGDCGAALQVAIGTGQRRIRITNGLQIDGPATLGSPERPVLLVVEGPLQLAGGVQIHGAVVHRAAQWDTSGTHDARIDGAVIVAGNVIGDGTPTIVYDRTVLDRLHGEAGVLVRVAGSWRDF
ncbi:MAG TPA: PilX N-terminal domain-containing pilus assembly protein [Burkholderiaceae bacterium]|nr:PilX N-terminal domain-containing pilus assembly protein [Burkholderiaceae bacterium]